MIHSRRANFTGRFHLFVEKRIKLKPEGKKPKLRKKKQNKKNRGRLGRDSQKTENWVGRWDTARHLLSAIKNKLDYITGLHWLHHSHIPEEAAAAYSMALPEERLEVSATTLSLCFSNAKGCCGTATSPVPITPAAFSPAQRVKLRVSVWQCLTAEPAGVGSQIASLTPPSGPAPDGSWAQVRFSSRTTSLSGFTDTGLSAD